MRERLRLARSLRGEIGAMLVARAVQGDRLDDTGRGLAPGLAACLERLKPLHTQLCPRQVLGARIGLHAADLLGLDAPRRDRRLLVFVETDGCLADGVAAATGCSVGRRTLRVVDYGKVAATFVDTDTGQAVRIVPHPDARQLAPLFVPEITDRWTAQREGYQVMPTAALLRSEPVRLAESLAAALGRPEVRVTCSACGEEILYDREIAHSSGPICRACAGPAYYVQDDHAR
jgi:formylmethanofuran dehydrogenase subunit E